jgi:type IV pilus assembly protein PilA
MRIFFALWPPAETARGLAEWAREAQRATGGKITAEDKIHLTLAFLGDADPRKAVHAGQKASGVVHALPLEQARYWRENNIVWVGPRDTPSALKSLHESLSRALYREEFILERRPFAAHVTLVRKARAAPLPPLPALEWPVREFSLVRSSLSSKGSSYEVLERFALGFTLIEILVVLAILAILAMMLVPTYHDRAIREQVVEALPLAEIAKPPIAAAWLLAHSFPADNAAAGLPTPDTVVSNVVSMMWVENGAIHLRFGNRAYSQIRDKTLTLRPAVVDDAPVVPISWICGFAPVPDKMTVKGNNRTDVPKSYLPTRCK